MIREYAEILIQRSLDSTLTEAEREELARALRDDPLLRGELEEMKAVHTAAGAMFRQIALPRDFSQRVMTRIQPGHVPADARLSSDSNRIPHLRRPQFIRRGRTTVVYWLAAFSTAAAVFLTVALVVQFGGPLGVVNLGSSPGEGRQGVPDSSGGNRTDPLNPKPEKREASEPEQGTEASQPGLPVAPREVAPTPDRSDARRGSDQVGTGNPPKVPGDTQPSDAPEQSPKNPESVPGSDGARVEQGPGSGAGKPRDTQAGAAPAKSVLGRLTILDGRAEVAGVDGKWLPLKSGDELREGAQIRTSAAGNANIALAHGTVTMAKSTTVSLVGGQLGLDSGTVAVDKPLQADSEYLGVRCDAYVFYVKNGAASIDRRRQKINVQHFVGLSTLTHDSFGSVVFDKSSTLEMEIGKDYPAVKLIAGLATPVWLAEARSANLWAELAPKLAERFSGRERRFIDTRLPPELDLLMAIPLDRGAALEFMARALENKKLDAACVVDMVRTLRVKTAEIKGSVPDNLAIHGARAAMLTATTDFATWSEEFSKLARGDDGKRIVTETWRKVTSESSEPGKIKRIEPPTVPPPEPQPDSSK